MVELSQIISSLSPQKQKLLERLLKEKGIDLSKPKEQEQAATFHSRIPRISRHGELPLSYAQQRLWFLDQLVPGRSFYNNPFAVRAQGLLDMASMIGAFESLVRRHEALRTSFRSVEGRPVQVINDYVETSVPLIDLMELDDEERQQEAKRIADEEAEQPFDLTTAPLVRARLIKIGEKDYIGLITTHEIMSDMWSLLVLLRELAVMYGALSTGTTPPLPELPLQYVDYAAWQREWFKGEVLQKQLEYWKQHLEGAPPTLELLTDHPRPPVQSFNGAMENFAFSSELSESLRELSRREGVTMFMLLLAAFNTLLYRYTGQEDIVVGSTIMNRDRAEIEGVIGVFVNALALRTELRRDVSFKELLQKVKGVALEGYANADVPFEKVVEEMRPERDVSRAPIFQVMLSMQDFPRPAVRASGVRFSSYDQEIRTTKFDLTLSFHETRKDVIDGFFQYSTDSSMPEPSNA